MKRFALALLWIGLCVGMWVMFAVYTFQFYAHWQAIAPDDIWMHWLYYHMIDLRWRAVALIGGAALPAIMLIVRAARSRER